MTTTAKTTTAKLGTSQRQALFEATQDEFGRVDGLGYCNNGFAKAARNRMMKKLVESGFLVPYVHGGWEITKQGREALQAENERAENWARKKRGIHLEPRKLP